MSAAVISQCRLRARRTSCDQRRLFRQFPRRINTAPGAAQPANRQAHEDTGTGRELITARTIRHWRLTTNSAVLTLNSVETECTIAFRLRLCPSGARPNCRRGIRGAEPSGGKPPCFRHCVTASARSNRLANATLYPSRNFALGSGISSVMVSTGEQHCEFTGMRRYSRAVIGAAKAMHTGFAYFERFDREHDQIP